MHGVARCAAVIEPTLVRHFYKFVIPVFDPYNADNVVGPETLAVRKVGGPVPEDEGIPRFVVGGIAVVDELPVTGGKSVIVPAVALVTIFNFLRSRPCL